MALKGDNAVLIGQKEGRRPSFSFTLPALALIQAFPTAFWACRTRLTIDAGNG